MAKIYTAFLTSSGDTKEKRAISEKVVSEINQTNLDQGFRGNARPANFGTKHKPLIMKSYRFRFGF